MYFSQAIFILTTNQGQEQVTAAYDKARAAKTPRDRLAGTFDDAALRGLLIKGVLDETEVAMKKFLRSEIDGVRERFVKLGAGKGENAQALVRNYLALREQQQRMEVVRRKSPLDRALLDRIDFIVPFFPIKERSGLTQILSQKLGRFDWEDCPKEYRERILDEAMGQDESVRPLERLIKKYYAEWRGAAGDKRPLRPRAGGGTGG